MAAFPPLVSNFEFKNILKSPTKIVFFKVTLKFYKRKDKLFRVEIYPIFAFSLWKFIKMKSTLFVNCNI